MREIPKDVALTLISLIFSSFCAKLVVGVSSTIPWQPVANDNNGQWYPKGVFLWFTSINVIYMFKKNQGWYSFCCMLYGKENYSTLEIGYRTGRPFLHNIDFYQRHDYQGIIKSNVKLNFFVPLHQHVSLLFFHHSAYHSEWLSWPCLCNFFTIISITYAEIVTSKNQLRHPKFYCITRNSKCNLYLFDLFVQHNCN